VREVLSSAAIDDSSSGTGALGRVVAEEKV
jgi:hypothetical protein